MSNRYATVKLGIEKSSNINYAFKIYPKFLLNEHFKKKNVEREIQNLKKLHHPKIIKLVYSIEDSYNKFYLFINKYFHKFY